jgi:hypothetical protein
MVSKVKYKGRDAVVIETQLLKATLLPLDGAKMASLVDKRCGKELLATKSGEEYRVLTFDGSYVDSECSAFDDMFPTIDPYAPEGGRYKGVIYPDHGEACRIPYDINLTDSTATFTARSRLFDVSFKKTVTACDDGSIRIDYAYENEADEPFCFIWAGHVMLAGEDGMVLHTPFDNDAQTAMMFVTQGYDADTLPRDRLMGFEPGTGAAYKFYYLDKMSKGYFGVSYADGRRLDFTFDESKLPYLGVWLNNGEFQGIYNIAPEPCTAPFDAPHKAAERGYASSIEAKGKFEFSINITLK